MGQFITISIILYKENSQVHRFMWCEDISECTEYFLGVLVGFSIEKVGLHEVKLGKKRKNLQRPDWHLPLPDGFWQFCSQSVTFIGLFKWPTLTAVLYEMRKNPKSSKIKVTPWKYCLFNYVCAAEYAKLAASRPLLNTVSVQPMHIAIYGTAAQCLGVCSLL